MGDIQDDIENKAEEVKDSSPNQHLGDAMDDADQEAAGQSEQTEADGPEQDDSGNALDDVDLEPPSS